LSKELRTNERIKNKKILLVDNYGVNRGILDTNEAIGIAKGQKLDLVEVSPNADPPVCRILDYGKYKFDQKRKIKDSRKKQKIIKLKEVRLQPKIGAHDLEFKIKQIVTFLSEGNKVKITVRFRSRELAHKDLGFKLLDKVFNTMEKDSFVIDSPPTSEGKAIFTLLSKKK